MENTETEETQRNCSDAETSAASCTVNENLGLIDLKGFHPPKAEFTLHNQLKQSESFAFFAIFLLS